MATVSTVTLESGLHLSVADQGPRSDQAIVLLPGPTDSWRSYRPVLDRLPSSIRAVAVSPRGHGDSDKPATGYAIEDFAADVVPLLDVLGIHQAVLAGHSGSCLVARRVALDDAERVAGLVLEASPTTLRGDARLQEAVQSVISTLEDPISPAFARSIVRGTSSEHVPDALVDELAEELLKVPAGVWHAMFRALLQYDDMTELADIGVPALLIWGDADGLVSRDMQDELLARLSKAELVVYPSVGHTPRWDDPARFSADVAAFAGRLSGG